MAYSHFKKNPDPPYIAYITPGSENFSADNIVYIEGEEVHIELYTAKKDIQAEKKVEEVLTQSGIYWERSEVFIEKEKLFRVLYEIEI